MDLYESAFDTRFTRIMQDGFGDVLEELGYDKANINKLMAAISKKSDDGSFTSDIADVKQLYMMVASTLIALDGQESIGAHLQRADEQVYHMGRFLGQETLQNWQKKPQDEGLDILEQLSRDFGFIFTDDEPGSNDPTENFTDDDKPDELDMKEFENRYKTAHTEFEEYIKQRDDRALDIVTSWLEEVISIVTNQNESVVFNKLRFNLADPLFQQAVDNCVKRVISVAHSNINDTVRQLCGVLFYKFSLIYSTNSDVVKTLAKSESVSDFIAFRHYRQRPVVTAAINSVVLATMHASIDGKPDMTWIVITMAWFALKLTSAPDNSLDMIPANLEFVPFLDNLCAIAAEVCI